MLVPIGHWRFTLLMWEYAYVRNLKSHASDCWGHLVIQAIGGRCFIKSSNLLDLGLIKSASLNLNFL